MPGVFGKTQRRRKFAQQGCAFPAGASAEWEALAGECRRAEAAGAAGEAGSGGLAEAAAGLAALPALASTFAERKALKAALAALERSAAGGGGPGAPDLRAVVVRALAGVAFCANSRPLHKQLLAALGRSDRTAAGESLAGGFDAALAAFAADWETALDLDTGGFALWRGAGAGAHVDLCERSLALSHIVVSVLEEGAFRATLAGAPHRAAGCARVLAAALFGTVQRARIGEHVHPGLVNLCQDACTALYSLLQASDSGQAWRAPVEEAAEAEEVAATLHLLALAAAGAVGATLLARDAQVTAGILLWRLHLAEAAGDPARAAELVRSVYFSSAAGGGGGSAPPAEAATAVDTALREAPAASGEAEAPRSLRDFVLGLRGVEALCCLRGCLAAAPLAALGHGEPASTPGNPPWNLLLDGFLPHVCALIENPVDTHFKFQAFHALQGCLHQSSRVLRHGASAGAARPGGGAQSPTALPALSKALADRLLSLILSSWEDPLTQTVKLVHSTFEKTLDLFELQLELGLSPPSSSLTQGVADVLLRMGPRRRGRYVPMGAIARRVGAQYLLDQRPSLLRDSLLTMGEEVFSTPVSSFLADFLTVLREERASTEAWMTCWAEDVLLVLQQAENAALRKSVTTYALPAAVKVDPRCFPELVRRAIARVGDAGAGGLGAVAGLVCLLKAGAKLGLLTGGGAEGKGEEMEKEKKKKKQQGDKGNSSGYLDTAVVPQSILRSALVSSDAALRLDTFELLAVSRKPTQPPTEEEFGVLRDALVLQFKCSAPGERSNWVMLLRKFMHNLSCAHQSAPCRRSGDSTRVEAFMEWFVCQLVAGCYPGSPYARKRFCMQVLHCTLQAWPVAEGAATAGPPRAAAEGESLRRAASSDGPRTSGRMGLAQSQLSVPLLTTPATVRALLAAVVDTWDDIRLVAAEVVLQLPSPLPGITAPEDLCLLLKWSLSLICSPRVRETDPGSALLRVIMRKYVVGLHWRVSLLPVSAALPATEGGEPGTATKWAAICAILSSALDLLEHCLERAEADLYDACRSGLAHGVLLALRHLVEDVPWSEGVQQGYAAELRGLCGRMRSGLLQATRVAMWAVVQQDELNHAASEADLIDEGLLPGGAALPEDAALGTRTQVVLTGCWLTVKEVSLLTGALGRFVPLPGGQSPSSGQAVPEGGEVLFLEDVKALAENSLKIMLQVKHNGTVEKSRFGATELVAGLLRSSKSGLSSLPSSWIEALVGRATQPRQSLNDISRRSSGLPFLLSAIAHGEPHGVPRHLLSKGMRRFLDVAARGPEGDTGLDDLRPAPRVQALHILFRNFLDADLALDTSPFYEEGMELAVRLFKDGHWAVRNAASQLFSALVIRMIGFKNPGSGASLRKGLTTVEFFRRYPRLLPFLRAELQTASQKLLEEKDLESAGEEGMSVKAAAAVDASLYPILALLSRLRPGIHETAASSEVGGAEGDTSLHNSPGSLLRAVRECGRVARTHSTRSLAAKALAPLVPPNEVAGMLARTLDELPETRHSGGHNRRVADSNSWSGLLLQAQAILKTFMQEVTDVAARFDVLGSLLGRVEARLWVVGGEDCYPVRTEFTVVVALLWSLAPELQSWDAMTLQFFATSEAVYARALAACTEEPDRTSPGRSVFLKKASSLLGALWASGIGACPDSPSVTDTAVHHEVLVAKIVQSLHSASWEVQAGMLKILLRSGSAVNLLPDNGKRLLVGIVELLGRPNLHFKVEQRALQVLCGLLPALAAEGGELQQEGVVRSLWGVVRPVLQASTHFKTQDACTVCAGSVVALTLSWEGEDAGDLGAAIEQFVSFVEAGSGPHCRASLREAVARALVGTPLLQQASATRGAVRRAEALRMWRVVLVLLEDESAEVREIVASGLIASMAEVLGVPTLQAGLQTSALLPCCLQAMTSLFGDMGEYLDYLWELAYSSAEMRKAVSSLQAGDSSERRLFERETDNNFAEPLVTAHLASLELAGLAEVGRLPATETRMVCTLQGDLNWLLEKGLGLAEGRVDRGSRVSAGWLGHPTEAPEAFCGLLRLALASKILYSLPDSSGESDACNGMQAAREQLGQLHARLRTALAHPVLLDTLGAAGPPAGGPAPEASCDLGRLFRAGPPRPPAS